MHCTVVECVLFKLLLGSNIPRSVCPTQNIEKNPRNLYLGQAGARSLTGEYKCLTMFTCVQQFRSACPKAKK
jgi:hypothetical protein